MGRLCVVFLAILATVYAVQEGPTALQPPVGPPCFPEFCSIHGTGGWCDGMAVVQCENGKEVSRSMCQWGCDDSTGISRCKSKEDAKPTGFYKEKLTMDAKATGEIPANATQQEIDRIVGEELDRELDEQFAEQKANMTASTQPTPAPVPHPLGPPKSVEDEVDQMADYVSTEQKHSSQNEFDKEQTCTGPECWSIGDVPSGPPQDPNNPDYARLRAEAFAAQQKAAVDKYNEAKETASPTPIVAEPGTFFDKALVEQAIVKNLMKKPAVQQALRIEKSMNWEGEGGKEFENVIDDSLVGPTNQSQPKDDMDSMLDKEEVMAEEEQKEMMEEGEQAGKPSEPLSAAEVAKQMIKDPALQEKIASTELDDRGRSQRDVQKDVAKLIEQISKSSVDQQALKRLLFPRLAELKEGERVEADEEAFDTITEILRLSQSVPKIKDPEGSSDSSVEKTAAMALQRELEWLTEVQKKTEEWRTSSNALRGHAVALGLVPPNAKLPRHVPEFANAKKGVCVIEDPTIQPHNIEKTMCEGTVGHVWKCDGANVLYECNNGQLGRRHICAFGCHKDPPVCKTVA